MNFLSLPLFFQTLLLIILLFLLLLNLLDLILGIKRKIRIPFILLNGLTLAISFFVLLFLKVSLRCQIDNIPVSLFVEFLAICPLWILLLLLFLLLFASLSGFLFLRVYTKSKLTPNSFKESFDSLDSLICFCQDNGLPCLVNKKMNDFHIEVFQSRLLNGNDLWENLAKGKINGEVISLNQGYNPIIKLKTGEIYSFKRFLYKKEEKTIFEIIGNDVTSYYSLLEEIKEKNDSLRRLNKRLFEYGEKINQLIIEKEILEAKRKVHDDLGKLLLVTKKRIGEAKFR
ncbi:MAG TPA: hypothetical protein DEF61_03780 [Firmicutes bacterium]|mgnify:FL=1|nr:hypothetical protein [Bacillota bacterium]